MSVFGDRHWVVITQSLCDELSHSSTFFSTLTLAVMNFCLFLSFRWFMCSTTDLWHFWQWIYFSLILVFAYIELLYSVHIFFKEEAQYLHKSIDMRVFRITLIYSLSLASFYVKDVSSNRSISLVIVIVCPLLSSMDLYLDTRMIQKNDITVGGNWLIASLC